METDAMFDPSNPNQLPGERWMESDDLRTSGEGAEVNGPMPALDPALFNLLLSRVEQLSRELGRAETQRSLIERHIARLEKQIEKLSHQQQDVHHHQDVVN